MFTGIIQSLGTVKEIKSANEKARMAVETGVGFRDFQLGESIAVNGVCLTVADFKDDSFSVDMTTETLNRTSFKKTRPGAKVNLERSLLPTEKISGHFVMGHVDQVGSIVDIQHKKGEVLFRFEHSKGLTPFVIEKGSVAVDGISLTAFDCKNDQFTVSIIPFTFEHTNLHERKTGDPVNLECDMIGKYVFKACETLLGQPSEGKGITLDLLKQQGFVLGNAK